MKIPVLFEIDPDLDHATGTVHPFCSEACLLAFIDRPDFVDIITPGCIFEEGDGDTADFDGCICTECCGPLPLATTYEVVVGNIGTVYSGHSQSEANAKFDFYVADSKTGIGRSGGESVYLMEDCEPVREYQGPADDEN